MITKKPGVSAAGFFALGVAATSLSAGIEKDIPLTPVAAVAGEKWERQRRACYHPQIKVPVGERIAAWALVTEYGKSGDIRWLPPTIREMKVEGGKMIVKMPRYEVIPNNDGSILGFAIAGNDGKFQPAKAEWIDPNNQGDRSTIVLSGPLMAEAFLNEHPGAATDRAAHH